MYTTYQLQVQCLFEHYFPEPLSLEALAMIKELLEVLRQEIDNLTMLLYFLVTLLTLFSEVRATLYSLRENNEINNFLEI